MIGRKKKTLDDAVIVADVVEDDLPVAPYRPIYVSSRGIWWRRFLALLPVLNAFLVALGVQQNHTGNRASDGNRRLLCSLVEQAAIDSSEARAAYEDECGRFAP